MLIEDEILYNAGLLEEGIVFFKNSKRLRKLSSIILQKTQLIEDETEKRKIVSLVNRINKLADEFEDLEKKYKTRKTVGDKPHVIREKYNKLVEQYKEIVQIAKKEQTKNILKQIGSYGTMLVAMVIPALLMKNIIDTYGETNELGVKDINPFAKAGFYIGSSATLRALNPTNLIDKKINPDIVGKSFDALKNK